MTSTGPATMAPGAAAVQSRPTLFSESYAADQGPGNAGVPLEVRTNYFQVLGSHLPPHVFVYSLAFPQISGRDLRNRNVKRQLIGLVMQHALFQNNHQRIATDWNGLLVSLFDLEAVDSDPTFIPGATKTITGTFTNQAMPQLPTQVAIGVQRVHVLDRTALKDFVDGNNPFPFDCSTWLTALNILARKQATALPPAQIATKVGRDKFFPLRQQLVAQWLTGLEPRRGYFNSIRACSDGLLMNVHAVATAFISSQPLLNYIRAYDTLFAQANLQNYAQVRRHDDLFRSIASQVQVRYMYTPPDPSNPQLSPMLHNPVTGPVRGRLRRINGFGSSARQQTFAHAQLGNITVERYFNQHVLLPTSQLRFPELLVANTGSTQEPVWVPSELLCVEPNQAKRGALRDTEMAQMLTVAQRNPLQNVQEIENSFSGHHMFNTQFLLPNIGAQHIAPPMIQVKARMLSIPDLRYNTTQQHKSGGGLRHGKWNLRDTKFKAPAHLAVLGVIHVGGHPNMAVYGVLANTLALCGMTAGQHSPRTLVERAATTTHAHLQQAYDNVRAQTNIRLTIVLLVLPKSASPMQYADIKAWGDTRAGVSTVCIAHSNVGRLSRADFSANIALKFNAKLGGTNHTLHTTSRLHGIAQRTMIVGADVTHPGVGSVDHCPSIAAVVASCDGSAVAYPGSLRLQKSKQEMIEYLDDMISERLELWHGKNGGTLPADILFYRDGVGESQFASVKRDELLKIYQGCTTAGIKLGNAGYKPRVTLVVCSKRHHTRFYPPKERIPGLEWALDPNHNFNPGLVVGDRRIGSPHHFDFYLQSHRALNGTARPCHYFVIHNDINMSADELQAVTFDLCWTFATALTPISYAAPAYYADRLCDRARCYLRPLMQLRHPQRPDSAELLTAMQNAGTATEDQKDDYVRDLVSRGFRGFWPGSNVARKNPQRDELAEYMFYI